MSELRDFDAERSARPDQQFKIAGETFTLRHSVRPEVLVEWGNLDEATLKTEDSIAVADDLMKSLLVPEDAEKWTAVRRIEGDGEIGLADIVDIVRHAIAVVSGRPTSAPSSSGNGRTSTGTPSTGDSPPRGLISVPSTSDE